jgi:hypothetical protein
VTFSVIRRGFQAAAVLAAGATVAGGLTATTAAASTGAPAKAWAPRGAAWAQEATPTLGIRVSLTSTDHAGACQSTAPGLRIALLIDLSSSFSAELPEYKAAAISLVDALKGTPSSIALDPFTAAAPARGARAGALSPLSPVSPVSVEKQAGVSKLEDKLKRMPVPTSWDARLWELVENRFAETENAIFAANALKELGSATIVVHIGTGSKTRAASRVHQVRGTSAPGAGRHYVSTSLSQLPNVLAGLTRPGCARLRLTSRPRRRPSSGLVKHAHPARRYPVTSPWAAAPVTLTEVPVTG